MSGCSVIIRTPGVCFAASVIMCKVVYIRCWKHFSISAFVGSMMYALLIAYMCRYANFARILRACGRLACWPIRFQDCSHAATAADPSRLLCRYIRHRRSALHFASVSTNPYPPICFGHCSVDTGTRKTAPLQMYHIMAVVSSCVYVLRASKICVTYQI
jgi:hypothetical protein